MKEEKIFLCYVKSRGFIPAPGGSYKKGAWTLRVNSKLEWTLKNSRGRILCCGTGVTSFGLQVY